MPSKAIQKVFDFAISIIFLCGGYSIVSADPANPIGEAVKDLPLFDAHIHYKEPAWRPYPPKSIIELMDKTGVAMGLVSSTPDEGTIKLWSYAPNRIVPELRPYHGEAGSSNWTKAPGMEEYLKGRLEQYPHEGIGEFHVHKIDPDDKAVLRSVAKMAKDRRIPIHIHSGAAPVELFYQLEPSLTIIWAHAGMSEPAKVVGEMFAKYKTLYADTSYRETDILNDDYSGLDPEWAKVIAEFPERLMVGSDTWVNDQWDDYEGLIAINRRWLSFLPEKIARMIAYQNAEKLFGRKISKGQIGKR